MAILPIAIDSETLPVEAVAIREVARSRTLTASRVTLVTILSVSTMIFGAVQPWAWGLIATMISIPLILWAWNALDCGSIRLIWTPLYVPAAIFMLAAATQFAERLTADPAATHEALVKLVADLLIFFLALHLWQSDSPRGFRRLGLAVTAFACGLALFAILQFFANSGTIYGVVRPRWSGWIFGPYVNHNHYAGLMEMLIPVALGYLISPRRRPHHARSLLVRLLGPLALLIAVASVLLSGSRGGMIALGVEAAIFAGILPRFLPEARRRRLALVGIAGVAASAALFLWLDPGQISHRLEAVAGLPRAPEATLGERLWVARDALGIFRSHPWLGTGLGSFDTVYPAYRTFPSDLEWDHAHDDYAEALAETGLAGGAAIVLAIGLFFAAAFGDLRHRLNHPDWAGGWIRLGAAIGCCGLLVHSFGDFNLHIPANAAWFAFFAGIACSGAVPAPGTPSRQAPSA